MINTADQLNRYVFENTHVRGELVQLNQSYQAMLENHNYPPAIAKVIGELFAATSLLTATLKFEGDIAVQIQGNGPVSYISINGSHDQQLRGVARFQAEPESNRLSDLFGDKGFMVITISPTKGERYQGIVALEKETIAGCLENYFAQSEQLPTHIWLFADETQQQAAGIMLQTLPGNSESKKTKAEIESDLEHLAQLTATISQDELFSLDAQDALYRLYHQETVKLFEPTSVKFNCGCSKERSLKALTTIAPSELKEILEEQGKIEMKCEYCLTNYEFVESDLLHLINAPQNEQ
ncbi:Hsp33 family molecular chaperone HslO [Catenovulum sp. 2E275]|uniref:Hsp33 family molecular chaperone HslO n=1 Tax=Catenovulum sp. 2E275 TaxID=2980497 RepID=UPI0021D063DB|nr:Hsp33 family molecular chaperone HslO [Catenovulum sp. 2E275]MCU4674397.1 Hsp33 family molecular chaperone HslO [Catenovulum sp. 2E275]